LPSAHVVASPSLSPPLDDSRSPNQSREDEEEEVVDDDSESALGAVGGEGAVAYYYPPPSPVRESDFPFLAENTNRPGHLRSYVHKSAPQPQSQPGPGSGSHVARQLYVGYDSDSGHDSRRRRPLVLSSDEDLGRELGGPPHAASLAGHGHGHSTRPELEPAGRVQQMVPSEFDPDEDERYVTG
jgi:hypothetical protein